MAREKKEFRKAERAAAASSKVIQRDQNILKRKASSQRELSLIEKIRSVERVNQRFQRDLRSVNSGLNSNRIKYALEELTKVQATLSLSSGYVTEAIDAHLLARPNINAKKPKEMSELDKVTFFIRGLKLKTREGVKYRQSIKAALEYERARSVSLSSMKRPDKPNRWHWTDYGSGQCEWHVPRLESQVSTDMEMDNVKMQGSRRKDSSKICFTTIRMSNDDVKCISFGVVKEVNDKGTVGTVVQVEPEAGKKSPALMIK
ncbi:hypothetical protein DYB28_007048 [Aphanomyces astaci]|uniref:Uncharacterized protein n=1 Tax=Aphanomyces astaci TaxID=112090 RepID=A0A9X8H888_APHAT|nr:hypothetical protein DYB28_007048 [Aphanomyces astaci]